MVGLLGQIIQNQCLKGFLGGIHQRQTGPIVFGLQEQLGAGIFVAFLQQRRRRRRRHRSNVFLRDNDNFLDLHDSFGAVFVLLFDGFARRCLTVFTVGTVGSLCWLFGSVV